MNDNIWRRDSMHGYRSSTLNRSEQLNKLPSFRSNSLKDISHSRELGRRTGYKRQLLSFEKAGTALFDALSQALRFCKEFDQEFVADTYRVEWWAPSKVVNALWAMKMEWNGIPAAELAKNPDLKPGDHTQTYKKVVVNLMQAWEDMMACDPISKDILHRVDSKLGLVEVKTSMNKLHVTFQGIEELVLIVRKDRLRMPALINQLRDARNVLLDLESAWDPTRQEDSQRN